MTTRLQLRRFPYPYRAMITICSDLDETKDWETYVEIARFMNTNESTRMGQGVGLEIGNTMYFEMQRGELSYWSLDATQRAQCRSLIKSGHIDCIHSFGDLAETRADAEKALNELARHQCELKVWVDHAQAPTNIGADIMEGHGDDPGHRAYHADLLVNFGVEYFWIGRVTSQIAQGARYRPGSQWDRRYPVDSLMRLLKDVAKSILSYSPHSKFSMHRGNRLMRNRKLRDGRSVIEFIRCDPHPKGISFGDNGRGIAEVLSTRNLEHLIARKGVSIIYTHLGKKLEADEHFPAATVDAFRRLKKFSVSRRLLVTTTRKLLDYERCYHEAACEGVVVVDGKIRLTRSELERWEGLTFYSDVEGLELIVDGQPSNDLIRNAADETGRLSYSLAWKSLEWPLA